MFLSNLFQSLFKETVHFINNIVEIRTTYVRIVPNQICYFRPLNLHTIVMKVAAFAAIKISFLTQYCRSITFTIDTDSKYFIFVGTLKFVIDFLVHFLLGVRENNSKYESI